MKSFEIWSEGFADSRQICNAAYLGCAEGETFREACINFMETDKKHKQLRYFNKDTMTFWGCRLFDNEVDARKSFG